VNTSAADEPARLLHHRVDAVACLWLVLLPLLRPLVWSGQPTDVPNLFFLVLLAAAATTGLLLRGLEVPTPVPLVWWRRPATWGVAFLALAAVGSLSSPLPAAAWTLTAGWALHIAAPWALWPAVRRHPHMVVAGLMAGLGGEALLLLGQVLWERPQLAAQLASDASLTVDPRIAEQYQVRIGSWRLEGTFLLANTLATFLLLVTPIALGIAWRARRSPLAMRIGAGALAAGSLIGLAASGSKAGILAGLVAGLAAAVTTLRSWRWRGLIIGLVLLGSAVALTVPVIRQALAASAGVRLDYWSAGIALVTERPLTGHGLEGFAVHYPRTKPPAGEETIVAHQETLQAAVDLGLPAMFVLLAWWMVILWSLRPARGTLAVVREEQRLGRPVLVGLPMLLGFALFAVGILQANFAAYPFTMPGAWALLAIAILTTIACGAVRLPLPTPLSCWCALLACVLHAQADFSLHSMQVVGVAAWVVMLGQALHQPAPAVTEFAGPKRQGVFAAAGLVILIVTTVGTMAASTRGEVLEHARGVENVLARLRLVDQGRLDEARRDEALAAFERAFSRAVVEERETALAADPREGLALTTIRQAVAASRRFPADHDLVFVAVAIGEHLQALLPQRAEVLTPVLEGLLADWPRDLLVIKALSEHYLRLARAATDGRRHGLARQAQALAHRAVELYPTHLPLRQTLIQAAELTGDQATITGQRAEIERLTPLVHRDNRLRG
jgi:O-antigen ligase